MAKSITATNYNVRLHITASVDILGSGGYANGNIISGFVNQMYTASIQPRVIRTTNGNTTTVSGTRDCSNCYYLEASASDYGGVSDSTTASTQAFYSINVFGYIRLCQYSVSVSVY